MKKESKPQPQPQPQQKPIPLIDRMNDPIGAVFSKPIKNVNKNNRSK